MKHLLWLSCTLVISLYSMNSFDIDVQLYDIVTSKNDESTKIEHIKYLLECGCDINLNLGCGFTALHYAVKAQQPTLCEFLIKQGANPHIENCDNYTPLQVARGLGFYRKREELTDILKSSSCTIYRPGMNRRYPQNALETYNKDYGFNLTMGPVFK